MRSSFILAFAFLSLLPSAPAAGPEASPVITPLAAQSTCPITQPSSTVSNPFLPEPFGPATFESDALATNLWMWGEGIVQVPDDAVEADGSTVELKWGWFRSVEGP